jgi:hypothetical protein
MHTMMFHRTKTRILLLAASIATASGLAVPAVSQADNAGFPSDDAIVLFSSSVSGMCLQPVSASLGAAIVEKTCTVPGSAAQQWWVRENTASGNDGVTDRFAILTNQYSHLCMDAFGGLTNGTPIVQWTCGSSPGTSISNEHWQGSDAELKSGMTPYNYNYCIYDNYPFSTAMELESCNGQPAELWAQLLVGTAF